MAESEPYSLSHKNTKRFIQLIQARPCLWDRHSPDYKDRLTRDRAWGEISSEIDPAYRKGDATTRHEISVCITKKWYNIRDSYVKSLKQDPSGRRNRPYIHADLLGFLDECYMGKIINSGIEKYNGRSRLDIEQVDLDEVDTEDIETEPWAERVYVSLNEDEDEPIPKRTRKSSTEQNKESKTNDEDIISVLSKLIQKEEDEDRAFFKSIAPSVKQLTEDSKLVFRIEVLQLIKKLKAVDKNKSAMKVEKESINESDSD